MSRSAWSEFQRIRAKYPVNAHSFRLDEMLFGWFCSECLTTSYADAGFKHILTVPEELALLVLDEAERQIINNETRQGRWDEFIMTVGRSPTGVNHMERALGIYSEVEQKKYRAMKQWKSNES